MASKTVTLIVKQCNSLFVPDRNASDWGETQDNLRYHWTDELVVQEIVESTNPSEETYWLAGESDSLGKFRYPIEGLHLIRLVDVHGMPTYFAFSKSILAQRTEQEIDDNLTIQVELLDTEPFGNPIPGIYLALADFPKELK
ncbi:MAG: hypothetical protein ACKO4K_06960 [Flavobacteriales bacterium]